MINKKIQTSIAIISVILIVTPTYANDCIWLPSDIYGASVETSITNFMAQRNIPSLAFSVFNGTEVFYTKGFGEQPETDNAYHLNSAAKMITGTAIMQLYEQGLIGLEDDFNDYLPYELKNPYYPSTKITIKHLLSYRSSIFDTFSAFENYWPSLSNGTYTFPSIIYEFLHENGTFYSEDHWENWEPGTNAEECDIGYDILTLIVENVTSTSFDTYVTENICNPLGMTNTRFSADDYSPEKLVVGYDWSTVSQTNEIAPYYNNSNNPGGGGYFSTVEDLSKFMLAHMNQGEYNGTSILTPATIELMHTEIETTKRGLGWTVRVSFGSNNDYQGHGGGPYNGFYSGNYYRSTVGAVLLFNQGINPDGGALFELIVIPANKLLSEKSCPEPTSFYLLPIISLFAVIVIFRKLRRREV